MQSATLSPWTMSYFAAACLMLLVGQGLMAAGYGYPVSAINAPETLVVVHVITIGWLSLLMAGALLQFVPVLVARPLVGGGLAGPALALLVGGLSALVTGFVALSGRFGLPLVFLPLGGGVLLTGFSVLVGIFAATLLAVSPLPLPARFVALGLASLTGAVILGAAFTLGLSGLGESDLLDGLVAEGVEFHAVLGLGGWLSVTAVGVSYRLLAMFLLAPESERRTSRAVWWSMALAVGAVAACIPLVLLALPGAQMMLALALVSSLVAVFVYCGDVLNLYRARRRKTVELNIQASFPAVVALVISILLFNIPGERTVSEGAALVYLFAFGWLTGLGLAQLYKIVAFLTWLEAYGPVLGKMAVPRVQDLVDESFARILFWIYYGAVVAAALALAADMQDVFRVVVGLQLLSSLALMREFIRTRRLSIVPATLRAPDSVVRPNLFLPLFVPRR
jgi:hypothetical protein